MVTLAWDDPAETIRAERNAAALSRVITHVQTVALRLHILKITSFQVWIQDLLDWDLAQYLQVHER